MVSEQDPDPYMMVSCSKLERVPCELTDTLTRVIYPCDGAHGEMSYNVGHMWWGMLIRDGALGKTNQSVGHTWGGILKVAPIE